jgi:hypothetical protein
MRRSNGAMPCAKFGMLHPFLATHRPFLAVLRPFRATLHPFLATLRPFRATLHPFLALLQPFVARLHAFAATRCEGEDARHEESRGHHALRSVPFLVLTTLRQSRERAVPSRERGSECVGSSSERGTTRHAYVAMPGEPLEMPNEDNAMRSMHQERECVRTFV